MASTIINNFNNNNSFEKISIPIILNQNFQFFEKDNIKCLSLCKKKLYKIYCNQVKKLKIINGVDILNLLKAFYKYKNIKELNFEYYLFNLDFIPISQIENLEILNIRNTCVSDFSFLEKNKNIKELNLERCEKIKDFIIIFKIEKLEILNISYKYF